MAKAPINNAGSKAGRGFRYQDAVGVLLALQGWAGLSLFGRVTPEANDDCDLASASEIAFAQVKSRRDMAGPFSASAVATFVVELWDRHDAAVATPDQLLLILERPLKGWSPVASGVNGDPLPAAILSVPKLRDDPRAATLAAKTRLIVHASPIEDAIALLAQTLDCTPTEASIHYGEILRLVGTLSDENGFRPPSAVGSIGKSDVTALIDRMRSLVALGDMEAALQAGICEAIDFITPVEDDNFYLGVDVEPGHIAAGLVAERPEARRAVLEAIETRGAALIAGPSGAGKSALMWDAASVSRHVVRWYRVRSLSETQAPMLPRLARALRADPAAPVGFIFDDVGGELRAGWDALVRLMPPASGTVLLGSIREEDLFQLETRAKTVEIRASADDALAERLWRELGERGQTAWAGWREPWQMAKGLMLEFAHILTQGERMSAVLAEQIDRRDREARDLELSILRITSLAGAASAMVDVDRLAQTVAAPDAEVSRALRRLVDEHLLRATADGLIGGMHQLRSAEILRLTHRTPPPTLATTIDRTVLTIPADHLERLIAHADLTEPHLDVLIDSLTRRLDAESDPDAATSAFRGLGERHIRATLDRWLPTVHARGVAPTLISTAVMFGITGVDLIELAPLDQINAAARDLRTAQTGDPRSILLSRLSAVTLERFATEASPESIEEMLASLVGVDVRRLVQALGSRDIDLAGLPLDLVVRLLGTISLHDPRLALRLVSSAGQEAVLTRLHAETPWTSTFTIQEEADGRVATGEIRVVAASVQTDIHGEVVAVAEKLFALVPDADIAAVTAISADGEPAGLPDFPTAVKRMPRSGAPAEALPRWNRRWLSATSAALGASSYTDFLRRGHEGLKLAVPALERLIDAALRGKEAEAPLARLGEAFEISKLLTSPASVVAIPGTPASESGAYISDLQSVIHDASSDLLRKFIRLPEGHGAFALWTDGLLERIGRAEQEPWPLLGADVAPLFERLRVLVRNMKVLAGEAASRGQNPALLWRQLAKTARAGNALRLVARQAEQGVVHSLAALKLEMTRQLEERGLIGRVYVRCDDAPSVAWPFATILMVIEVETISDWHPLVHVHWEALKAAVGDRRRLVLAPLIGGIVASRLTVEGVSVAFPSPYVSDRDLQAEGHGLLDDVHARRLSSLLDAVFEQAAMRLYDYGDAGRPRLEREACEAAAASRTDALDVLLQGVGDELQDFPSLLNQFLHRIDQGELAFAEQLAATLHGHDTLAGQQVEGLQYMLLTLDLITQMQGRENGVT